MADRIGLYLSHPSSLEHDPRALMPGHPDTPERLLAIERLLGAEDWLGWQRREAPAAPRSAIELIHEPRLIAQIERLAAAGGGSVDLDTVVGEASYRAALHAAGGACEMVRALLAGEATLGFSAARPPGHHAEAQRAMGFCLFNSAAIAAALAIAELGARRVFILDWDVHHGDGTNDIFRATNAVLFASIHQSGAFPGTGPLSDGGARAGEGYSINLPVQSGSHEDAWFSLLEHVVVPAAEEFQPDLVLISAGYDGHRDDRQGSCELEASSFAEMARYVRGLGERTGAPVGAVLEGGYALDALAAAVCATMEALAGDEPAGSVAPDFFTSRAASHVGFHWRL
jgi:acetoin utilization deacetylase AcuC-like enzyme